MFIVVSCVVVAVYFVSVSSFNLAIGVITFGEFASLIAAAITAIVIAFKRRSKMTNVN
jgi:hypothetical protein